MRTQLVLRGSDVLTQMLNSAFSIRLPWVPEVCLVQFPVSVNVSIVTHATKISKHLASNPNDFNNNAFATACPFLKATFFRREMSVVLLFIWHSGICFATRVLSCLMPREGTNFLWRSTSMYLRSVLSRKLCNICNNRWDFQVLVFSPKDLFQPYLQRYPPENFHVFVICLFTLILISGLC